MNTIQLADIEIQVKLVGNMIYKKYKVDLICTHQRVVEFVPNQTLRKNTKMGIRRNTKTVQSTNQGKWIKLHHLVHSENLYCQCASTRDALQCSSKDSRLLKTINLQFTTLQKPSLTTNHHH